MPELPDIHAYLVALEPRVVGESLRGLRVKSPFLVRSIAPPIESLVETRVTGLRRLGKRIVFAFEGDRFLVVHLMIAGRFRWRKPGAGLPGKIGLAAFDFDDGALLLTEAGSKRRAKIHVVEGEAGLAEHDPGGAEIADLDVARFAALLREENHTLKRSLTDPRVFSGIGNAYSDEILLRAKLSPLLWTSRITDDEVTRLFDATRTVLDEWCERLAAEARDAFPEKVTAFRDGMAAHGRFGEPCPACDTPIQRIVYASNETNYCPTCQTGGKLLADRALSQLLKKDWPRTLEELEARRRPPTE